MAPGQQISTGEQNTEESELHGYDTMKRMMNDEDDMIGREGGARTVVSLGVLMLAFLCVVSRTN